MSYLISLEYLLQLVCLPSHWNKTCREVTKLKYVSICTGLRRQTGGRIMKFESWIMNHLANNMKPELEKKQMKLDSRTLFHYGQFFLNFYSIIVWLSVSRFQFLLKVKHRILFFITVNGDMTNNCLYNRS